MDINEVIQQRINQSNEELDWRPIKNIEGYLVNQFGQIKSLKRTVVKSNNRSQTMQEKILKVYQNDKSRCLQVSLCIDGIVNQFCIRRLIAEAFHGIDRYDKEVIIIHKNEDYTDCYFENIGYIDTAAYRTSILEKYKISSRRPVIATHSQTGETLRFESVLETANHFEKEHTTLQRKVGSNVLVNDYSLKYED